MAIKHTFSSPKADGGDATLVRPSDWNATHDDGGLAAAIDIVSNAASVVSVAAADALSVANAASNAVSVVSNALSNEISNRVSADNVLSAAIGVVSAFGRESDLVEASNTSPVWEHILAGTNITITEQGESGALLIDATGGAGSVTSTEASAISATAAAAIDVVSNAVSVVSNAVSIVSTAASNALSVANAASNAASIVSIALLSEISNRVSADNALSVKIDTVSTVASNALSVANAASNAASIVSNALSVVSVFVDHVDLVEASNTSPVWEHILAGTNITITEQGESGALLIDATPGSGSVTSTELSAVSATAAAAIDVVSNAVSVVSNAVSIVSTAASNALSVGNAASNAASIVSLALLSEISNRISADNVLSNSISVVSNAVSIVSTAASNALSVANAASNAASIVSNTLSNEISNRVSADNVLSIAIEVVSVFSKEVDLVEASNTSPVWEHILAGANITITEQGESGALLIDATGGAGSVTSNEASAISATAAAAINVVSNAVSIVSTAASNALSVANAASNAASIVSNALSNEISNRVSADNVLSNAISVVSNALSALEVRVSSLSTAPAGVSVTSAELAMAELVDGSDTQQIWEELIAGENVTLTELGDGGGHAVKIDVTGATTRVLQGNQGISVATLTNVSGFSVSVVSAGVYRLDAMLMIDRATASAVVKLGLTFPSAQARGYIRYTGSIAQGIPSGTTEVVSSQGFFSPFNGFSASNSTIVSAGGAAWALLSNLALYQGLFVVSTSGTLQIVVGASTSATTGLTIIAGSYMQVFRLA